MLEESFREGQVGLASRQTPVNDRWLFERCASVGRWRCGRQLLLAGLIVSGVAA